MFTLKKTQKVYHSPLTTVAEVDLEGLVCTSGHMTKFVDELHNINSETNADGTTVEPLYFEF